MNLFKKKKYSKPSCTGVLDNLSKICINEPEEESIISYHEKDVNINTSSGLNYYFSELKDLIELLLDLGCNIKNRQAVIDWVLSFQQENGFFKQRESFVLGPTTDAVRILQLLNEGVPHKNKIIDLVAQAEQPDGSISLVPGLESEDCEKFFSKIEVASNVTEVLYRLKGQFKNAGNVVAYLARFQRNDGLFFSPTYQKSDTRPTVSMECEYIANTMQHLSFSNETIDNLELGLLRYKLKNGGFDLIGVIIEDPKLKAEEEEKLFFSIDNTWQVIRILSLAGVVIEDRDELIKFIEKCWDPYRGVFRASHLIVGRDCPESFVTIYHSVNLLKMLNALDILED